MTVQWATFNLPGLREFVREHGAAVQAEAEPEVWHVKKCPIHPSACPVIR
jgi:hypothetical protein